MYIHIRIHIYIYLYIYIYIYIFDPLVRTDGSAILAAFEVVVPLLAFAHRFLMMLQAISMGEGIKGCALADMAIVGHWYVAIKNRKNNSYCGLGEFTMDTAF